MSKGERNTGTGAPGNKRGAGRIMSNIKGGLKTFNIFKNMNMGNVRATQKDRKGERKCRMNNLQKTGRVTDAEILGHYFVSKMSLVIRRTKEIRCN